MKKWFCCLLFIGWILTGCDQETEWSQLVESSSTCSVMASSSTGTVVVHVCGAVKHTGVYELEAGARYADAIEAAGGATKEGVPDRLNLAQCVVDGEKIYVPSMDETKFESVAESGSSACELININTADVNLLQTLRGIGQAKAEQIVAYRETHGDFKTIEDLMKVPGIKEGAFAKVKDQITV